MRRRVHQWVLAVAVFSACLSRPRVAWNENRTPIRVGTDQCSIEQYDWVRQQLWLMGDLGVDWELREPAEVTVVCNAELVPGRAGEFTPGIDEARVDPTQIHGEREFRSAVAHELIHWAISRGPHPERAEWHICKLAWNEPPPEHCYPGNGHEVMAPVVGDIWITAKDREFFRESMTP